MFCSQTGQIVLYLSEKKQKMKTPFVSHRIIQIKINMSQYVNFSDKSTSTIIFKNGFKLTEAILFFTYPKGTQHASNNSYSQ